MTTATVAFFAHPNLTAHLFAECAGRWFAVNGRAVQALTTAPRIDSTMKVDMTAHRRAWLRDTIEQIEKITA